MPERPLFSRATGVLARVAMLAGSVLAPTIASAARLPVAEPTVVVEPDGAAVPGGFSPAIIEAAYGLSPSPFAGVGQTIAIVDSFDNANVATDLATFDAYWGLPACTGACFTKVDQTGGTSYPAPAPLAWSVEIAMDVEWAHAIAPAADILLVEANNSGLSSLLAAETYAGAHATYVSNSWGYPEFSGEAADSATFEDPGVSYFAAVADAAGRTQYPATSPDVVAVGGTQPTAAGPVPWTSGGGGCSAYEEASSSEATLASQAGCSINQLTPVVSADAVGIGVFDVASGWLTTGGTSFATVLWAAAAADSGRLVTNQTLSSGSIPLDAVVNGTLLRTGLGGLGAIPPSVGQTVSVDVAIVETA